MPGDGMSVTLSRPFLARTPRMAPRTTPGLSLGGTPAAHLCTISSARSRNRRTSRPITAAGTMPKFERAEYRPPMLGMPKKMCRNPSRSATCCNFDPGSVMAMKRSPTFSAPMTSLARWKKYCVKMLDSKVVPDLLDTMNTVRARSTFLSTALI